MRELDPGRDARPSIEAQHKTAVDAQRLFRFCAPELGRLYSLLSRRHGDPLKGYALKQDGWLSVCRNVRSP